MDILLAEDQPVNQQVAVAMLEGMGHEVTIANNGVEALEILRAKRFDFIFMDCQMPEMDGYTATMQIRKMMKDYGFPYCPIIALTAHAMMGDREKCLSVGMDDYLSKPLDEKDLEQMINKWLGGGEKVRTEGVNNKVLDNLRDLMGEKFTKLIETYILNAEKTKQDIIRAVQFADNDKLAKCIHGLRGSAQQVGAIDLATKLSETEKQIRESNAPDINGLVLNIEKVNQELGKLIKEAAY